MKSERTKTIFRRISQASLLAFYAILLFVNLWPPTPGESRIYLVMVAIAILPMLFGPDFYRMGGLLALILAVVFLRGDIKAGKMYREKRIERLERINLYDREVNR